MQKLIEDYPEAMSKIQKIITQMQEKQKDLDPDEFNSLINEIQNLTLPGEMPRRIKLCYKTITLVDRNEQKELWGALQNELANSFAQNPLDDRADNLEQAIKHYRLAIEVYTKEAFPQENRQTSQNLGDLYFNMRDWEKAHAKHMMMP